jgi:rhamnulokinase
MFDSLALSYRDVKGQIESLCKRKLKRIRIVGGGCRNKMLNQLCANACELPVMAGRVEASTLGNVSAQLIALGVVENLTAARDMVRRSFPLEECLPKDAAPENVRERFVEIQREKVPCA